MQTQTGRTRADSISVERDGDVAVIWMARGKANALNREMVEDLGGAVNAALADNGVRALMLASRVPRIFSAGFDVRDVFGYDRERMTGFFGRFIDLYETLFRSPKPVVAALNGHTFAGGAILAIVCDFRVMAEAEANFALSEVNLGLVVTPGLMRMITLALPLPHLREMLLTGEPISSSRAFSMGLVSALAPVEKVHERALLLARTLGAKPASSYAANKRSLQEAAGYDATHGDRRHLEEFVDLWFSPEAVQSRSALLSKLA